MAKRIALWAGDNYYPSQALGDFVGFYETVEEAKAAKPEHAEWAEVYELQLGDVDVEAPAWAERSQWPTYSYNAKGYAGTTDEWRDNG